MSFFNLNVFCMWYSWSLNVRSSYRLKYFTKCTSLGNISNCPSCPNVKELVMISKYIHQRICTLCNMNHSETSPPPNHHHQHLNVLLVLECEMRLVCHPDGCRKVNLAGCHHHHCCYHHHHHHHHHRHIIIINNKTSFGVQQTCWLLSSTICLCVLPILYFMVVL